MVKNMHLMKLYDDLLDQKVDQYTQEVSKYFDKALNRKSQKLTHYFEFCIRKYCQNFVEVVTPSFQENIFLGYRVRLGLEPWKHRTSTSLSVGPVGSNNSDEMLNVPIAVSSYS